jgi:hypothetical protein
MKFIGHVFLKIIELIERIGELYENHNAHIGNNEKLHIVM